MRAEVYYNIHKQCLSVREVGGRLLGHCQHVVIRDAEFVVSQAGNERVRREGRKNVHAVVRGDVKMRPRRRFQPRGYTKVTYNPYLHRTFVRAARQTPVHTASEVFIRGKDVYAKGLQ